MRESRRLQALRLGQEDQAAAPRKKKVTRLEFSTVKPGSLDERLLQAGILIRKEVYFAAVFLFATGAAYIASVLGLVLGLFVFASAWYYALTLYLEARAGKRRQKIVPQLPAFIDGLASALSTGFNLEGAVMQATQSVPVGLLRAELDRVVNGLELGLPIDDAFGSIKRRVAGKEIISLSVAIVLFAEMGGRLLEPFRRLAQKIRDQQLVVAKAQRDLVQIRQAFNILLFLSFAAPGALLLLQPDYLDMALKDWTGRLIVQVALIMQIMALLAFKKLTTLRF